MWIVYSRTQFASLKRYYSSDAAPRLQAARPAIRDRPLKTRSHVRTDHLIEKNGNADEAEYQWKETGDGSQEQHPH